MKSYEIECEIETSMIFTVEAESYDEALTEATKQFLANIYKADIYASGHEIEDCEVTD